MIGRRAVIGLSLLCALLFSAFAVQSASAATTGTTAFTCVKVVVAGTGDFKDAHCDETSSPLGTGEFTHEPLASNPTEVEANNEKTRNKTSESTPALFKAEAALSKIEFTCTTVKATETIKNSTEEVGGNIKHTITIDNGAGGDFTTTYSGCVVLKPSTKCTVTDPVTKKAGTLNIKATGMSSETVGALKNEMGILFSPEPGKPFAELLFEGAECALNTGKAFPIEGSMVATGTPVNTAASAGATLTFTEAMTKETLSFGGKSMTLSSAVTMKMVGGNPISLTTPTAGVFRETITK
jgi:hypothetical protein